MKKRTALFAALLVLLALLKLLCPGKAAALRSWAEGLAWPGAEETVAAWGRSLGEDGEPIPVLRPGGRP